MKWFGGLFLAIVLGLLVIAGLLYFAVGHEPEFYRAQVAVDPVVQQRASDELLAKTAEAVSGAHREGEWSLELTDAQINGWLAVVLPMDGRFELPEMLREPRVQFKPGRVTIASRYDDHGINAVLSLECDLFISEASELSIRVRSFRCGAVPIPMQRVLDAISEQAVEAGWRVSWSQQEGDPVAHVKLPPFKGEGGREYRLEAIEIDAGSVRILARAAPSTSAGTFERRRPQSS